MIVSLLLSMYYYYYYYYCIHYLLEGTSSEHQRHSSYHSPRPCTERRRDARANASTHVCTHAYTSTSACTCPHTCLHTYTRLHTCLGACMHTFGERRPRQYPRYIGHIRDILVSYGHTLKSAVADRWEAWHVCMPQKILLHGCMQRASAHGSIGA